MPVDYLIDDNRLVGREWSFILSGALVQLVRMPACLGNSQGMSLGKGLVMIWN